MFEKGTGNAQSVIGRSEGGAHATVSPFDPKNGLPILCSGWMEFGQVRADGIQLARFSSKVAQSTLLAEIKTHGCFV